MRIWVAGATGLTPRLVERLTKFLSLCLIVVGLSTISAAFVAPAANAAPTCTNATLASMGLTGSGNSITVVGNNCLITLVNATTYSWTLPSDLDPAVGFSYLVVGGGGGGNRGYCAYAFGSGGGGGAVVSGTISSGLSTTASYSVKVAAGGAGAPAACPTSNANGLGGTGGTSSIDAFVTAAGGYGAVYTTGNPTGGASGNNNAGGTVPKDSSGTCASHCPGAGGGGAKNAGSGINGGAGISFTAGASITGAALGPFGGGGAGLQNGSYGSADANSGSTHNGVALANSGAGGTDYCNGSCAAGAGGSGIIYISYTPEGAPTISGSAPSYGSTAGGTSVTLTGTNFNGTTGVTVGGVAATGVTVNSSTSLTFVTPASSGGIQTLANIVLSTTHGSVTLNNSFTYSASTPATSVTATGTNAASCNQTGANLGNGTTDVTAVGTSSGYCVVTFATPSINYSWTVPTGVTKADVLVVGGGGAGGTSSNGAGGGGGGGQVNAQSGTPISGSISVQVASGGTPAGTAGTTPGGNGGTSSFTPTTGPTISASGGSGGASVAVSAVGSPSTTGFNGGGGSAWATSLSSPNGSNGIGGYKGGASVGDPYVADPQAGGGGGGSGGNGANAGGTTGSYKGGNGGGGVSNSYVGSPTFYGGGGGGGKRNITTGGSAGVGGSGGGGAGGMQTAGTAGTANTGGGGGGGGGENNVLGGAGGSGVVILSYPISPASFGTASIAGTAQVGSVLTASSNTAAATSTTYQWQSSTSSGGTYSNISGATSNTYTPTTSDYNTYLKVAITVTNTSGTATQTSTATAAVAAGTPTITGISPSNGPLTAGTSVTITGTNFQGVTGVKFGSTAGTSVVVASPTSITVSSPAGSAGSVDVTVTNGTGTSATSSADVFTYVAAPTITSLSATSGPIAGNTTTTITGTNLTGTSSVTVGGVAATLGTITSTTVVITTPAGTAGSQDVVLVTRGGTATKTSGFIYYVAPTITSLSVTSGPLAGGTAITITGTNLLGTTGVTVGGVAATLGTITSTSVVITTTTGSSSGLKDVVLTTPGGSATLSGGYSYLATRTLTIDSGSYASTYNFVATPPTLTATASAGSGAKTFTSSTTGVCTVGSSSGVVAFVSVGTCTISASIAADSNYSTATSSSISFTTTLAPQTVTWAPTTALQATASPVTPSALATALGSATISYAVTSAGTTGCTVNPSTGVLTFTTAGSCQITATAAATANYAAANTAVTFVISLATRTLTIDSGSYASTYNFVATPPTLTATASAGTGAKTFTSSTTGVCTVGSSSGTVAFVSAGTCTITASIAADSNYSTATSSSIGFTITKSADATLSALTISTGTLSPTFASATTSYSASVANSVSSITVTPTVNQVNATVKVNGTTVISGSASSAIALSIGSNAITVVVTAQDGTTTKTYTLTITRLDLPAITSISPSNGPASGSTSVTITGTALTGATGVTVGGVAATGVVVNSATSVTFVTPAGTVGSRDVVITTPGGNGTLTGGFLYGASAVTATGSNIDKCAQTGTNLGSGTSTDITAVGTSTGYCIVTFKNPAITYGWTVPTGVTSIRVLTVGGGAGGDRGVGGYFWGHGGGGGQVVDTTVTATAGQGISIGVGAAGTAGIGTASWQTTTTVTPTTTSAGNGGSSNFGSTVAAGGQAASVISPTGGTSGSGKAGGTSTGSMSLGCSSTSCGAGGGGGAGSAGSGINGGTGIFSDITGTSIEYGAGGAGENNGGFGTAGGGASVGADALANRGGGGSDSPPYVNGTNGGSGVVILSYPMPPSFSSATISGTAKVGTQLTASASTITGASTTTTYQWQSSTSSGGTYSNISGATSNTYTPTTSDYNTYLKVAITVTNTSGTATQTSTATAAVAAKVITIANLGITAPVFGATPITSISDNGQYSATIVWSPTVSSTFAPNTAYTATVSLTVDTGYTLTGLTANFFTNTGATVTNTVNGGSISVLFTATAKSADATLSALMISAGTLSPTFTSTTTSYSATVLNATSTLTLTPTVNQANATTLQYLGSTGTTAFTGALAVGQNVIRVVVTAQDGTTTKTYTVTITRLASQTITRTSTSPTSPVKSGTYTPTATATSSLSVTITIATASSSICSISAGVVTFNTVGTCVIQYDQSGNATYDAAPQVTETLTIGKATPTLSTWANVSKTYGDSTFTPTAPTVTGSLAGTFSYSSASPSVISISGTTFTVAGGGTSIITATFTPTDSTNYTIATATMTVTVGTATRTLAIDAGSYAATYTMIATPPTLTATASAGSGAKTFTSSTTGVCTVGSSSGVVAFVSVGTCTISASIAADSNYSTATSSSISFTTTSASALVPSFSTPVATADGFTVQITNYNSAYTWTTPTVSAGSVSVGTPSGSIETLTVTGISPLASATITQGTTRTGYSNGSATVTGSAFIGAALTPSLGTPTGTADGFTVVISNYSASYTWTYTTTAGVVSAGTASGSNMTLTVTGLAPGSSATVTAATSRTSYLAGTSSVSGTSSLSSDKTLSSLTLSSGTLSPVFASGTPTYAVTVTNSVSSITITPTVHQINATIQAKVGSNSYSLITSGSASGSLALSIGLNSITILVTAQDSTTGTYTLNVTRSASTDATLSALAISTGTLSPAFTSSTNNYAVAEINSVSTITVTPTVNQAYATIQVKIGSGSYTTVNSGVATSPLTLAFGANNIVILVTAQDNSTVNTYTVVATRAPPAHGITYNLGGGSGTLPTQSAVTEGLTFQTSASTGLTYPGYTFNKWNDGTNNYSAGATYTMSTSSVVLTATWTATQQTVTYLAGTGGSGTPPSQSPVATASNFTTAANTFTLTGYDFAGWSNGTTIYQVNTQYLMGINNVTLTATWTPQVYTVTYNANSATGSPSRTSDSYTYATSPLNFPTVGSMTKTGYTFAGWSTTTSGSVLTGTYTPVGSITLNAIWTPNIYSVSFSINGASGSTPSALSYTVDTAPLTLPGVSGLSYPGYNFGGWATSTSVTDLGSTYTPTASITLQALWTPISYTITYNLNGGDSTLPTQASKTIGTTFTIADAATRSSYYFAGWSDQSSIYSAGSTYTVGTSDVTLTAVWIPIYTVHYNMNGASTTAPADSTIIGWTSTTSVPLEAAPIRTGYTFGGWLDQNNLTHGASSTFTVIENSTLSAIWTAIPYAVTYSLGSAPGSVPAPTTVTIGTTFTIAAAPSWSGYIFTGWSDSAAIYGARSTYTASSKDIAFTAQWSAIDYTVGYDVNGATSAVPSSLIKNVGQSFTLPGAPTKNGWIFDGWADGIATNPYGASTNYSMPAQNVILTANYHAPAPTITSLSTTTGSVLGATSTTITGTNFTLATSVTVGGSAAIFTVNSDTSLSVVTPSGTNGAADVVVTTTGGAVTKSGGFTYTLLTQVPLVLTTISGTVGTNLALVATGGSGTGALSFSPNSPCSIHGGNALSITAPGSCTVYVDKAADSTYAAQEISATVTFSKMSSTVALSLSSNSTFASYNFTIPVSATVNTPGTVAFLDDGVSVGTCSAIAAVTNVATCNWTPTQIKNNKVLTAVFTPTDTINYETTTASTYINVMASSLSGLNPVDLSQLGSIAVLANSSNSQTFSTSDTTLKLTVPANALPSGSTVHLLLDTNGTSLQALLGTKGYLLNSIVAWNAPDGTVPSASVPISLEITNSSIRKGMVVYGYVNGVSTLLGTAVANGTVTVYLTEDPVLVIAPTVPDAPTSVLASNGQNQHSVVSWLAPSNDGGQPITGYTVTSSGGQSCQTTGALSCDVQNLLNGTAYTFTVIATNAVGPSAASSQSPSITPVGPPVIVTPISGLTTVYNRSYQLQLTASGSAPIQSYAVTSGSLPAGLSLNGSSGLISGAATATGSANIKITATDSNLQTTETALFTITVTPETPTATLALSPTTVASTGTAYTATVTPTVTTTSSSTTYTYSITDGTATGCAVTGTSSLTITANSAGTCLITATVAADSNYNAVTTSALTFTFTKKTNQTPIVQTVSGFFNTPTTIDVVGSLGTGVLTFTTTSTGCTFGSGSSSNVLTATQSGNCLITVTNPGDTYYESSTATANISFGLTPLSVPTSISTTSSTGTSVSITFTGDTHGTTDLNVYVDATTITPLLTLHTFTSGDTVSNLTAGTTYYFTLTSIGNSNYSTSSPSARFSQATLPQAAQPVVSIAPSTSSITVGQSITLTATATTSDSGSLSYQWSNSGGIISGATLTTYTFTPASTSDAGSYSVTVTNTKNGTQTSNTASATVVIAGALSITTPVSGLSGTVGPAFSVSVPAGGGATPLSYAITSGLADLTALGLQLDSSTATAKIVGTPIVAGSANVVVTVTDANSQSASTASFTITIASATQTLAFTLSPNSAVSTGTAFTARVTPTVTNSGAGTGAITYAVSNGSASGCSIFSTSGIETITATSAGTCQIVATKAADSGYQSATSAPVTFTFTQATQSPLTITSGTTGTFGSPFTLTSSGGSGTGVVTYSASGTGCSINGSTLTVSVVTSCLITATNAGDLFYAPISSTAVSVNFGLASQTTPVVTSVSPNGSTTTLTVSYTVDSHGTSVTLTIYDTATAGSPIKTVTNFASGTSVTGLTAGTTYYVAVMSVGSSTYANSAQSLRVAGTTLTGATAPVIDVQPTATSILITVGQSETLTVTAHSNDGGALTYQWFRGADSLSGATSAQYSFHVDSSLQSAAYSVLITNSLNGTSASTTSNTISITVSVPIQIATPSTGLGATQGFAFSLGITASGGTSPLSYSVSTGAAALTSKGLTINPSTGVISGTPTETGTVTTAVTVTDAAGASATTGTFDITIVYDPDAPTPTFSAITQTVTGFTVRVTNYDAAYTWSAAINLGSITNSIPSGSNWLLTVTGLTPGQSAAITVTASGVGFQPMSASITGAALGAPAPIPPSFFVKDSPVKISLTGNTFTFTAAKLRFSFHGGPLEPAVLSSQIINLMGNGTVLVSLTSIAETQTVTVDSIITGMTYTFQEVAAEKGLVESFDSHNFSVEYSMSLADRAAQQQQEKIYYAAVADVLAAHRKAVNQLTVAHHAVKKMSLIDYKIAMSALDLAWRNALVAASVNRQKAIYDLAVADAATLRAAGISIKVVDLFQPKSAPISGPTPAQIDTTTVATPAPTPTTPAKVPATSATPAPLTQVATIYFVQGSTELTTSSKAQLVALAASFVASKKTVVLAVGNSDLVPSSQNEKVSQQRSISVVRFLAKIAPKLSYIVRWNGSRKPAVSGTSQQANEKNRRVDIYSR